MLATRLADEGITFELGKEVENFGAAAAHLRNGKRVEFDAILSVVGREPNFHTLNLDAAGVHTTEKGVTV